MLRAGRNGIVLCSLFALALAVALASVRGGPLLAQFNSRDRHGTFYCNGHLPDMEAYIESQHGRVSRTELRRWLLQRMSPHIEAYRRNTVIFNAYLCRGESADERSFSVDKTPLVTSWGVGHCIRSGKKGIIGVFVDTDIERRVNLVCDALPSVLDVETARKIFTKNPLCTTNIAYSPDGLKFTVKAMTIEGLDPSFEPIDPSIIYDKGKFRVFFFNSNQGGIYSCASTDGVHYVMEPGCRLPYKPTADLVVYRFGTLYRIFWNGVYSATSKNGTDFELDKGLLFLGGGPAIYPDKDGFYKMLYTVVKPDFRGAHRARSKDGVTWTDEGRAYWDVADVFPTPEGGYVWYVKKVDI